MHSVFTFPWITPFLTGKTMSTFRDQESRSTNAVAKAARAIILATQSIEINTNSPHWSVLCNFIIFSYYVLTDQLQAAIYLSHDRIDQLVYMCFEKHEVRFDT